jgi:hypothetical protein
VSIAVSADGSTLAVGAIGESSGATGIDGDQTANKLDHFGMGVALSADGNTLAVGAPDEDGLDDSMYGSGAVYVFHRAGTSWAQEAYVKASNAENGDLLGGTAALSADGDTLAVGAWWEDYRGAVYVFTRSGSTWSEEAYVKPPVVDLRDGFGYYLSLAGDGETLVVSSPLEDSTATGVVGPR